MCHSNTPPYKFHHTDSDPRSTQDPVTIFFDHRLTLFDGDKASSPISCPKHRASPHYSQKYPKDGYRSLLHSMSSPVPQNFPNAPKNNNLNNINSLSTRSCREGQRLPRFKRYKCRSGETTWTMSKAVHSNVPPTQSLQARFTRQSLHKSEIFTL